MAGIRAKHQQRTYLLVFLCAISHVHAQSQDCVYQECSCVDTSIICEAKELSEMPTLTSSSKHYSSLNLDMNGITNIPEKSLPPNLTEIFLDENPTTTIAYTAFDDSLSTLQTLSFTSALFTRIPDAFCRLKTLTTLNLQDMNIQDWNEDAMKNVGQTIKSLNLDNVGLTTWPSWLRHFSNITELTISRGALSSIPDDALANVVNTLTSLTLQSNNLTTVPKALSNCTVLYQLDIQQNKISDVSWLPQASKLFTLSLSNNLISDTNQLSTAIRPYEEFLGNFDVHSNRLTAIPNISGLTSITVLDFSNNRITDPYSGAVAPTVRSIDFSYNLLTAIPQVLATLQTVDQLNLPTNAIRQIHAADFPPSASIVDLGYNLITELMDNSFPANSKITSLNLNNNPIATITNGALKNLVNLVELNLQSTRLTRLPLALGSLSKLYVLDMSNSDNLVCTCQEKSLEHVILKIPSINVSGSCGLVDLYQFFSQFSPAC